MNEDNQRKYNNRMERLQTLIALNAPSYIIARECLLVAGAVFDIASIITLAEAHAGPDHKVTYYREEEQCR